MQVLTIHNIYFYNREYKGFKCVMDIVNSRKKKNKPRSLDYAEIDICSKQAKKFRLRKDIRGIIYVVNKR